MIFYFTGTGNSEWAAMEIGKKLEEKVVDIAELINGELPWPTITNEKVIGLVFPVYAWSAPEIVMEFIKMLDTGRAYAFAVCTCGEEAGHAMQKLAKKMRLNSGFSIVMPNNYILGADVDTKEEEKKKIDEAILKINRICEIIEQREKSMDVTEGTLAGIKTSLAAPIFNKFFRKTDAFCVTEACDSCGLCAKRCPSKNISIANGTPKWDQRCYHCLSCINRCPRTAIQYGTATVRRGRYYYGKNGR